MKILITGGLGFLGSNLACESINRGYKTIIMDNFFREGTTLNYNWLKELGDFILENKDIRQWYDIEEMIKKYKPDVVFHTAGQVAMTTSLNNPRLDFEVNALGTFNLLEAIRKYSPETMVLFSSTNKVYGDLEYIKYVETETRYIAPDYPNGFDESLCLNFHSPYGCSKGTADQYLLDYNRMFNIKTVVFRHSSMYGGRQFATYDQGWIGWFVKEALRIKNGEIEDVEIHGNGKQVRDVLHADDMVNLYFKTVENIDKCAGEAFNIGGGMDNSLSLLELFGFLEDELGIKININKKPWRCSDQKIFVADVGKINKYAGWKPKVYKEEGLRKMIKWSEEILGE